MSAGSVIIPMGRKSEELRLVPAGQEFCIFSEESRDSQGPTLTPIQLEQQYLPPRIERSEA
jgi:hypothetical protein